MYESVEILLAGCFFHYRVHRHSVKSSRNIQDCGFEILLFIVRFIYYVNG